MKEAKVVQNIFELLRTVSVGIDIKEIGIQYHVELLQNNCLFGTVRITKVILDS